MFGCAVAFVWCYVGILLVCCYCVMLLFFGSWCVVCVYVVSCSLRIDYVALILIVDLCSLSLLSLWLCYCARV